jgi:hypothetical protein
MTTLSSRPARRPASASAFVRAICSTGAGIAGWLATAADYFTAAAAYERLSGLADAELRRRGMSRERLGRDVCRACDRASR